MITYPLNNIDYTAEDAELYFSTRESGVYDGGDFEVTVSGIDNDVTVGTGIAWIHNTKFSGKVVALKEPKTLTLSLPNSVYDRIDAIVIQFDANNNATDIIVKEGIASSSPVAPAVVRTESLYELHIFHVQRKAGATVISVDNLVDLRNDSNYCGIMFDPISSIDATLTKRGFAADAAETGKQIKRATNVLNLLDNSDFTNPVNQRGLTIYNSTSYAIDRWKLTGYSATIVPTLEVKNGYITVNPNGDTYARLIQNLENYEHFKGKRCTIAVNIDGEVYSGIFTMGDTAGAGVTLTDDVEFLSTDSMNAIFDITAVKNLYWVAVYEGEYTAETLPPYVPKGYGAELAECRRYYRQTFSTSPTESARSYVLIRAANINWTCSVDFDVPMRVIPNVTLYSPRTGTKSRMCEWNSETELSTTVDVTASKNGFIVSCVGALDVSDNAYYFHYTASADL